MSTRIGSSEKFIYIDLSATVPPFTFQQAFAAQYPTSGRREFNSRAIVAVDGPGTLTLTDAEGAEVEWPMAAYEVNDVVVTGIVSADGITAIKVML
jgi:hypothetical protein